MSKVTPPAPTQPTPEHHRWFAAAEGRHAWMLWGKASPSPGSAWPGHPLLCHMLDVAWVARAMLASVAPEVTRRRMIDPTGLDPADAVAWLTLVVALHDIGKVSPAFQAKAPPFKALLTKERFDFEAPADARDHGTLGVVLGRDALRVTLGVDDALATRLARAVAAHHGSFASDRAGLAPPKRRERGNERWDEARRAVVDELVAATGVAGLPRPSPALANDHAFFALLAGLTSVADWVGSMAECFPYAAPTTTVDYLRGQGARVEAALRYVGMRAAPPSVRASFRELFGREPWPLHVHAERVARALDAPSLVVIEAPMGEGKTEAALLVAEHLTAAAGNGGLYVGLPTQATANQMFTRVERHLRCAHAGGAGNLHLAHGEASLNDRYDALIRGVHAPDGDGDGAVRAERWFVGRKRTLLASHAVGTVDQALLGVLRAPHGFVRLFGLAGKVVVLDEVHAYDAFTSTILDRLVAWLRAAGASIIILSATLPSGRRAELLRAAGAKAASEAPYPRITAAADGEARPVHFPPRGRALTVGVTAVAGGAAAVADELLKAIADGGCAGWVCNTVARAQDAYRELLRRRDAGALPPGTALLLLHARLLAGDRAARERELEGLLGAKGERPERCVVVGTQVLEQSLDVDFDILATDLAPIDLLLQRAGRLHRHDRGSRRPLVDAPRLLLVRDVGGPLEVPLRETSIVYDEYVMRRTLLALEGREAVALPGDIEALVEAVYTAPDPAAHAEALAPLRAAFEEERRTREQNARARLMPRPDVADDPFADFGLEFFDDEDPRVHEALRAVTRLGPPSVDVVCLHRVNGGLHLDPAGAQPVKLSTAPDRDLTERLLRHAVGVATRGLAPKLIEASAPKAWEKSAVLRHRRVVEFTNGRTRLHGYDLALDPVLGLVIARAKKGDSP